MQNIASLLWICKEDILNDTEEPGYSNSSELGERVYPGGYFTPSPVQNSVRCTILPSQVKKKEVALASLAQ